MTICMIMTEERDGERKKMKDGETVFVHQNKILRGNGSKNRLHSFGRETEKKEVETLESKYK